MVKLREKAAKSMSVLKACISTFVRVKPLDIFKETSGQFFAGILSLNMIFF